jgi:hypothetical protein
MGEAAAQGELDVDLVLGAPGPADPQFPGLRANDFGISSIGKRRKE